MTPHYFALFGLSLSFNLSLEHLSQQYYLLAQQAQSQLLTASSPMLKRMASQMAANINDAYKTLKDPILRARYLAEILSIDLNVTLSVDFLEQCMEWQETSDIHSVLEALDTLEQTLMVSLSQNFEQLCNQGDTALPEARCAIAHALAQLNYIMPLKRRWTLQNEENNHGTV